MTVAMIQIPMSVTVKGNTASILESLKEAKQSGATVAIFPECAVTGYHPGMGLDVSREKVANALSQISKQCQDLSISAIVGCPYYASLDQARPWNAAVVIDDQGIVRNVSPKVIFTNDEIQNNIFEPGPRSSRISFELDGEICAILICIEFAGEVGNFTSQFCREFMSELFPKPTVVFVIGVMDLSAESLAPPLAQRMSMEFNAHFILVNASEWGFGTPSGKLGGSLAFAPTGDLIGQSPWNMNSMTVVDLDASAPVNIQQRT